MHVTATWIDLRMVSTHLSDVLDRQHLPAVRHGAAGVAHDDRFMVIGGEVGGEGEVASSSVMPLTKKEHNRRQNMSRSG